MKIYTSDSNIPMNTLSILQQLVGKDLWVRCWTDYIDYDDPYYDISGYNYIKVLSIDGDICTAHIVPIADLTDTDSVDIWDKDDLEEIMARTLYIRIADIDFDVNNFKYDQYSTADIKDAMGL